jgi:hypothetical protein
MALAYLLGKPLAKALKVNLNVPLIMVLSIIPDIDVLFEGVILHRGPTHSAIIATIIFIPIFLHYKKKTVPYFVALLSHALIADFFIGGQITLFLPLTQAEFGLHELGIWWAYFEIDSLVNVALELSLFAASIVVLVKSKDIRQFFQNKKNSLVLIIPIGTVLLPSLIGYPLTVPTLLVAPHLFFLVLFSVAVLVVFFAHFRVLKENSI